MTDHKPAHPHSPARPAPQDPNLLTKANVEDMLPPYEARGRNDSTRIVNAFMRHPDLYESYLCNKDTAQRPKWMEEVQVFLIHTLGPGY